MATEEKHDDPKAAKKKGGGLVGLLVLLGVAVLFGAAGFAVPMFFPQLFRFAGSSHADSESHEEGHGGDHGESDGGGSHGGSHGGGHGETRAVKHGGSPLAKNDPAFINFGEVVVNLNSDRFNRYLRVSLTIQVKSQNQAALEHALDKHKAIVKNWLLSFLSDQGIDEIRGAAGQNRLRREIQNQMNAFLCPDGVDLIDDILFGDFSVQ